MDLSNSVSSCHQLLISQQQDVILLNAIIHHRSISVGLLGIHGSIRAKLATENIDIDLYDRSIFIARVRLPTLMAGDRNGYIAKTILQILWP